MKRKMTRKTRQAVKRRPGQIRERHDLAKDSTRQANLEEACCGLHPSTGHYGCPMMMMFICSCSIVWYVTLPLYIYICLSDRLKSEVALCGELLELSMIHDTWKPAHGIPASGTCICHVSSGKENWNNICVHTDIGPTALSSRHRRKFVAFVSKSGNITSVFQFASVQTEFSQ